MADPPSASSIHSTSHITELTIPPSLKFLISNLKNLVPIQLTVENYSLWRHQLLHHFTANGFLGHLTGSTTCPSAVSISDHQQWQHTDRNLVSALLATISQSILPYVITSSTACEIWQVLEKRLQPTNRSRVIQLKNELHHIQMGDKTMQQYLEKIKILVDNIASAGSTLDSEDIILYILNGLPSSYSSFKSSIRTSLLPIDLDTLYSLLSSEEINLQHEQSRDSSSPSSTMAMFSQSNTKSVNKNPTKFYRNRNSSNRNQKSALPVSFHLILYR